VARTGRGIGHKERVEEGESDGGVFRCENRMMKPVEIVLRRGTRDKEKDGQGESKLLQALM
jgi:hypothetical protein